ncbi:hypothetical protein BDV95DRAFT_570051 [Massariosphaeria phaeospora]|uniref:G-patch domain-containing protein n=1 Tax=Massariosphaeria phaeospora TaxID=100035 RepID=A0A7C8IAW7_9PLEO|nr:hypothetical protein BDV95DRAFT_570051 [Massariosphaeria phaeospora]
MAQNPDEQQPLQEQAQPPQEPPPPARVGNYLNPYAHLLPPELVQSAPKKPPEKKIPMVNLFHNPHAINRPKAKGLVREKRPMYVPSKPPADTKASRSSKTPPTSATPPTSEAPPISKAPPKTFEDWVSTPEEDARRLEMQNERKQRERIEKMDAKTHKKFEEKHGTWRPDKRFLPANVVNQNAYLMSGACQKNQDSFEDYIRKEGGHPAKEPSKEATSSSDGKSSPNATVPKMFAPPPAYANTAFGPPAEQNKDETGEEAWRRRARLTQQARDVEPDDKVSTSPPPAQHLVVPPPTPSVLHQASTVSSPPNSMLPTSSPIATYEAPPVHFALSNKQEVNVAKAPLESGQITHKPAMAPPATSAPPNRPAPVTVYEAAPVYFARPTVQKQPTSSAPSEERPAKKQKVSVESAKPKLSIAERIMQKQGFAAGQGLGANNDGITEALSIDKSGNGSGMSSAPNIYAIRGGERSDDIKPGKFGVPASVIVTFGCTDGVDLDMDAERGDGGIRQEIGDHFRKEFGAIERIVVSTDPTSRATYIKFNSPLSALNAIDRIAREDYVFNDSTLEARYYDEEKLMRNIYDH